MASGCADEIAHANEGETSARRVATRPRPGTPAPNTGETPARRVATTPRPGTPAPHTGADFGPPGRNHAATRHACPQHGPI